MSDTTEKDVRIAGRFVRWEVVLGPSDGVKTTNTFMLGTRPWALVIIRYSTSTCVKLKSAPPPDVRIDYVATISFEIDYFVENKRTIASCPKVEIPLDGGGNSDCIYGISGFVSGRFSIEIKFIDIKSRNAVAPSISLWPSSQTNSMVQPGTQSGFAAMLNDGILPDITVSAVGGSIRAHRAVLTARSPVLMAMFTNDLKEKEQSMVDISDMSLGACRAFIGYLYGNVPWGEFLPHRSELVAAGNKYGVIGIKETCERSMLDDIDTDNLLDRLQMAHMYGLSELKRVCMSLLFDFKKVSVMQEDFQTFLASGDEDLVAEVMKSYRPQADLLPDCALDREAGSLDLGVHVDEPQATTLAANGFCVSCSFPLLQRSLPLRHIVPDDSPSNWIACPPASLHVLMLLSSATLPR
ncbi:hypothetical protein ACP70R_006199 [Stipagrostis hirtigluma subsp. patula]